MIGFTGSSITGGKVLAACSHNGNIKKCAVELGGKSPFIIMKDI